jgi:hypothetical protein
MKTLGRALAVSALLAMAACGTQTSGPEAADDPTPTTTTSPASPEPTPTATASTAEPTHEPVRVLTTKGVPEGASPHVPYLALDGGAWNLVEPDGTKRPLDREYGAFAPMGDGLVGTTYSGDVDNEVAVLDGDLHQVSAHEVRDGGLAVSPDGAIVGWLGADGRPHVVEQGGAQEWDLPEVRGGSSLAALISDGTTCKEGVEGSGCAAFVDSPDGTRAWSSISHGIVDVVPGVLGIGDVAPGGAMVAMTSVSDEGSCWGRFQVWKPEPVWETCDYTLFDFSPSGSHILAGPAYLDGFGQGLAAVLDDDGHVVAEWHSRGQAALLHTVWEDDDHVLAIVFEDDAWAVLRLGVADGTVELAVPPVPDSGGSYPFVLPTV